MTAPNPQQLLYLSLLVLYPVSIYPNLCLCHCLFPAYLWVTVSPFIFSPNVTLSLFSVHKDKIISMVTNAYCQECPYLSELCPLDFLDQLIVVVMFWRMFKGLHRITVLKLRWTFNMHKSSNYNSSTGPLSRAVIRPQYHDSFLLMILRGDHGESHIFTVQNTVLFWGRTRGLGLKQKVSS